GLRSIGRGSWVLVGGVRRGLAGIGSVLRRGRAIARRLSGVVTRLRRSDTARPSAVQQPEVYEHTAPSPPLPAATPAVSVDGETTTKGGPPSARQAEVLSAPSTAAIRRKRLPVVTTPASVGRPRQQRVTGMLPSLDLLDAPSSPQRGQSAEELETQA